MVGALMSLGAAGCPGGAEVASGGDSGAAPLSSVSAAVSAPVPNRVDEGALAQILAAAPSTHPASTLPDGGTRIGRDTGIDPAGVMPSAAGSAAPAPDGIRLEAGGVVVHPLISSPAVERAAREQVYWTLHQKCRGDDGEPPPPDAIILVFTILPDGSVDPASVGVSAEDDAHREIAACVRREFSAVPFRGPMAGRDSSARVIVTWPSVD